MPRTGSLAGRACPCCSSPHPCRRHLPGAWRLCLPGCLTTSALQVVLPLLLLLRSTPCCMMPARALLQPTPTVRFCIAVGAYCCDSVFWCQTARREQSTFPRSLFADAPHATPQSLPDAWKHTRRRLQLTREGFFALCPLLLCARPLPRSKPQSLRCPGMAKTGLLIIFASASVGGALSDFCCKLARRPGRIPSTLERSNWFTKYRLIFLIQVHIPAFLIKIKLKQGGQYF